MKLSTVVWQQRIKFLNSIIDVCLNSCYVESLTAYIHRYSTSPLSKEDCEVVKSYFIRKKLRKRQYLLQEGEVCKYFAFIVKGATRQYLVDEKGAEHYIQLAVEDWWVGDRESWVMSTPSKYNIDAWEECELLLITRSDVMKLIALFPAFEEMVRKMDERNSIASQNRIAAAISFTAEKRYHDFAAEYPELLQRFPQHIIASYIGISKDTLSRLRKQSILR
jgi:CRP-like cAMP-binding protein